MKKYRLKKNYIDQYGNVFFPQLCEENGDCFRDENKNCSIRFDMQFVESNKEFFEEIIEKKDILRWDNGAIMEVPGDIYYVFKVQMYFGEWYNAGYCAKYYSKERLEELKQCCQVQDDFFLTKEEAQLECEARNTRAKLMRKIKEIDRESGFFIAYSEKINYPIKYYLQWDFVSGKKRYSSEYARNSGQILMSKHSQDYMMSDAVSDREFKMFLGIKD
jgi:hypothetical protein